MKKLNRVWMGFIWIVIFIWMFRVDCNHQENWEKIIHIQYSMN